MLEPPHKEPLSSQQSFQPIRIQQYHLLKEPRSPTENLKLPDQIVQTSASPTKYQNGNVIPMSLFARNNLKRDLRATVDVEKDFLN